MQVRLSREREFTLDRCFRRASCRAEKTRIPNQRIDGVALPAAVRVVDAIALIVAAQESCIHELGNRTAEIAFARSSNARAHFLGHGIERNGFDHHAAIRVAMSALAGPPAARQLTYTAPERRDDPQPGDHHRLGVLVSWW